MAAPGNQAFGRPPERKSRRTHKNSRDGCPNCKAKRIKCTEELPSCANCVKKNYRCGYLDFPREKLEMIRQKNYRRKQAELERIVESDPRSISDSKSLLEGDFNSRLSHNNNMDANDYNLEAYSDSSSMNDSKPNSNVDKNQQNPVIQEPGYTTTASNSSHSRYGDMLQNDYYSNTEMNNQDSDTYPYEDSSYSSAGNSFHSFHVAGYKNRDVYSHSQLDVPPPLQFSYTNGVFNDDMIAEQIPLGFRPNEYMNVSNVELQNSPTYLLEHEISKTHPASTGSPLPNAISSPQTFTLLKIPFKCQNFFLRRYLKYYRNSFKYLVNQEYRSYFAPTWTKATFSSFWTSLYNQAMVLDMYFSFLMDRSLALLYRTCDIITNSDIVVSDASDAVYSIKEGSTFTKRDLSLFANKSYVYYGAAIRDIRKSINNVHIEYPTKLSLFSTWSNLIHVHSNIHTFCLMSCGTSSLSIKILTEANSIEDVTPTIKMMFDNFNRFSTGSFVPDYPFDIMLELYCDFLEFKNFVGENGKNVEEKKKKGVSLQGGLARHDFYELKTFLEELINDYYPKIKQINDYYKLQKNIDDNSGNIYFTSTSLLYNLLTSWVMKLPSSLYSLGSHCSPSNKVLYLFYFAVGKALFHVLSPIRSIMIVDTCHIFCPKVDFDPTIFMPQSEILDHESYQFLKNICTKLSRVISFFNHRLSLYASYLSNHSNLHEEYLRFIPREEGDSDAPDYKDVLHILPPKMNTHERFITSFEREKIEAYHFPVFDLQDQNLAYQDLMEQERFLQEKRIHSLPNTINLDSGLCNHDFDPSSIVNFVHSTSFRYWQAHPVPLEDYRIRLHNYDASRREIVKALKHLDAEPSQ
ncbi:Piso0_001356 [Millerozyma farinosa CBS 7064]|uniref:Piso0_001356 protein n=1 Tax=Pichia sorbitophila (strain ATCC MYA-4447 / BCRC 22081 / CBS 7064 / NBRC 10061 / NRRL Y-12695) TaxID=559304 RepID=G8YMJ1_PICSO|nr:Piso0_001356 [Millerozyma farinosa CBS 7064]